MEEVNFNESAVEETVESEKALNCDSCEPQKTKTPALFKTTNTPSFSFSTSTVLCKPSA